MTRLDEIRARLAIHKRLAHDAHKEDLEYALSLVDGLAGALRDGEPFGEHACLTGDCPHDFVEACVRELRAWQEAHGGNARDALARLEESDA